MSRRWAGDETATVAGLYAVNLSLADNCKHIQKILKEKGFDRNLQQIRKKIGRMKAKGGQFLASDKAIAKGKDRQQMDEEGRTIVDQGKRINQLEDQVRTLTHRERKTTLDFSGDTIRFGVISDTHFGSIFDNVDLTEKAYDVFQEEGIETVCHVGDIVEGFYSQRQGHAFELRPEAFGYDLQLEYAVKNYPKREGISTKLVSGNHDQTWIKLARADICQDIANKRPDIIYCGEMEATLHMRTPRGEATVTLMHPNGGGSYATSYKIQKYIEALTGGEKPSVFVCGHHHKSLYFQYRSVHAFHAGTTMSQSLWMKGRNISAEIGFWIVELRVNEVGVVRCSPTFFKDFS